MLNIWIGTIIVYTIAFYDILVERYNLRLYQFCKLANWISKYITVSCKVIVPYHLYMLATLTTFDHKFGLNYFPNNSISFISVLHITDRIREVQIHVSSSACWAFCRQKCSRSRENQYYVWLFALATRFCAAFSEARCRMDCGWFECCTVLGSSNGALFAASSAS